MKNRFLIYSITAPTGEVYLGIRNEKIKHLIFQESLYHKGSLAPYINTFGWEKLEKKILYSNLTKLTSQKRLYELCMFAKSNDSLINKRIFVCENVNSDRQKEYAAKWREANREEFNRRRREYYWNNREKALAYQNEYQRRKRAEKEEQ